MAEENTTPTTGEPISAIDPYEYLQMTLHPNGTITRRFIPPASPASADPSSTTTTALSIDHTLNSDNGTYVRLFLPKIAHNNPDYYNTLPIVVYFHGGGFCLYYVDSKVNHDFCELIADSVRALVVSVEYRLTPEHRLPAAYDDALEALTWLNRSSKHPENWIARYGDVSKCFLMGSSAGGNIAYIAGLRAATELEPGPVRIRGLILHTPFFGGVDRTDSENRLANNPSLPVAVTDVMWELSLGKGEDRDHEYCNPVKGGGSGKLERVKELGWKVLLTGCTGDPLIDKQVELVKLMEESGVGVVAHITPGGYHGVELDPSHTPPFLNLLNDFIVSAL